MEKKAPRFFSGLLDFTEVYFFFFFFGACFPFFGVFTFLCTVSKTTGDAINKDEYVPTITPISNAKTKPLITSPPKMKIVSNTTNVLRDVLKVRLKVLFNAVFMIWNLSRFGYNLIYSLTRSYTTTVSLIE